MPTAILDVDGTLVDAVAGHGVEMESGDRIRAAEDEAYAEVIDEVVPLEGAHQLDHYLSSLDGTPLRGSS